VFTTPAMVWFAQLVLSDPTKGDDSVPLATPLKNDANETHGPWVPCRFSYTPSQTPQYIFFLMRPKVINWPKKSSFTY
jgi:hypothetical protein